MTHHTAMSAALAATGLPTPDLQPPSRPTLAEAFARVSEAVAEFGPPEKIDVSVQENMHRYTHRPGVVTREWTLYVNTGARDGVASCDADFEAALARLLVKFRDRPKTCEHCGGKNSGRYAHTHSALAAAKECL